MISSSLGLGWAYPWVVAAWTTGGIAAVAVLTPVGLLSATGVNGEAIVA
jgi:hypothetical protein